MYVEYLFHDYFWSEVAMSVLLWLNTVAAILEKQLSQTICSKYVFTLLHAQDFQIFSKKLNMMVKVVKLFTEVLWRSCADAFYRKTPIRSLKSYRIKFDAFRLRKRLLYKVFSCEFYQIFQNPFFANHLWVTAPTKYLFLIVTSTPATKNVSLDLDDFKYFWDKQCELLVNSNLWRSHTYSSD